MRRHGILAIGALLVWLSALPARAGEVADWNQFRGPDRNGVSTETNWRTDWPKGGPKALWTVNVGVGCSSPVVVVGRVYTMGNTGKPDKETKNEDSVLCLNGDTGEVVWTYSYESTADPVGYEGGPTSTPCVDGKLLYAMSHKGRVVCLDVESGKLVWENTEFVNPKMVLHGGYSGSPLVEGNLLIVTPGKLIAFDKTTGRIVWKNDNGSRWASPVPFVRDGRRLLMVLGQKGLMAVDPADGKPLWTFPCPWTEGVGDPMISGDEVFVSAHTKGCGLVNFGGDAPRIVWQNMELSNYYATWVLHCGFLYAFDGKGAYASGFKCIEFKTGDVKWAQGKLAYGTVSLMLAGDKLVMVTNNGTLIVAEASPEGYREIARASVLKSRCSAPPLLWHGRIYCRSNKGDLVCLDVSVGPEGK